MKQHEIRALANKAYSVLDDSLNEAAIERALVVMENAPRDPESYLLMSEIAEEYERFDHAIMWLDRGLFYHPHHEALNLKKASVLMDGFEDIDEAFTILLALKQNFSDRSVSQIAREIGAPLLLEIYLLLIDCYRLQGKYLEALQHAQTAHQIDSADEKAILALATAYFEVGNFDSAEQLLEEEGAPQSLPDFLWLKAQLLCACGLFSKADHYFARANASDKARYHRPIRLDFQQFASSFNQAIHTLPREIREVIQNTAVEIHDVIPIDQIKASNGSLAPHECIAIQTAHVSKDHSAKIIMLYQKNIENLASKKSDIKDIIASALLHQLATLVY